MATRMFLHLIGVSRKVVYTRLLFRKMSGNILDASVAMTYLKLTRNKLAQKGETIDYVVYFE